MVNSTEGIAIAAALGMVYLMGMAIMNKKDADEKYGTSATGDWELEYKDGKYIIV